MESRKKYKQASARYNEDVSIFCSLKYLFLQLQCVREMLMDRIDAAENISLSRNTVREVIHSSEDRTISRLETIANNHIANIANYFEPTSEQPSTTQSGEEELPPPPVLRRQPSRVPTVNRPRLPRMKMTKAKASFDCGICTSSIDKGAKIYDLRCSHLFCSDCIYQWRRTSNATCNQCPLCRKNFYN